MMLETALVARLATIAPHLYPVRAPKNYRAPCAVYNRLDTDPVRDLDGGGACAFIVMQIDIYDAVYLTAKQLAAAIRDDLTAWSDGDVESVALIAETDGIDDTTEVLLYRTMLHFILFAEV